MIGVLPASGVGAFIPGSMSGGQITPPLWPSFWPRGWLLRSCLVQPCVSVCAEAEHIAANSAATAIPMRFPVLLIQM